MEEKGISPCRENGKMETKQLLKERLSIRTSALTPEVIKFIEKQIKKGKSQTIVIRNLLEKGLDTIEQKKAFYNSNRQAEGESIETHQYVKKGDQVLIPCPRTDRWVTKRQCEGCHLKCNLPKDIRARFEGLALFTKIIDFSDKQPKKE